MEVAALIATEKLAIKNMTRSAKGTSEKYGKNVKQKAGLKKPRDVASAQVNLNWALGI
ncbi:TPA: hypothetical protein RI785_002288 [Vibrio cholerae]|nr:hypothetical protein [Vibrio cholerae]HDV5593570.1 hypothetical protein [Vibrio cholerae]